MEREEEETLSTPGVIEKYQTAAKVANGNSYLTQISSVNSLKRSQLVARSSSSASGLIARSMKNSPRSIIKSQSSRALPPLPPSPLTRSADTMLLYRKIPPTSRKVILSKSNLEYMLTALLPS